MPVERNCVPAGTPELRQRSTPTAPSGADSIVSALLRRIHKESLTPVVRVQFGSGTADCFRAEFSKNGESIHLSGKEAELLRLLIHHRGQALPRETILRQVWKGQIFFAQRNADVHIAWLRQKT